jgi:ABC-type nitrate/sulfonate/bicarbonate transport system substrate-binding protein
LTTPKKRSLIIIAVISLVIAIVLSSFVYLNSQNTYSGKTENLSFGTFLAGSNEPYAELVYIAQDEGFFSQNGINLTITDYTSATNALNAAINNEVELVISSEYAFVTTNVLKQGPLNIITTIDKTQSVSIVCRKDRGIETIPDLVGKKIGLTFQIAPQFYLSRFLELNNIAPQDVTQVNIPTTQYVTALVNGTVDAVIVSGSTVNQIEDQLPNNTVVWSVQSDQLLDIVVSARSSWITQHTDLISRFLSSLIKAEDYSVNHAATAQAIAQKRLNTTTLTISAKWSNHQFSLSLDQSLIGAMQDESRWLIQNNLTNATTIPDFPNFIYKIGLESVKPEAVNMVS